MGLDAGRLKHRIEIQALQIAEQANLILLENSDKILLENSDLILTEHASIIVGGQGPDGELNQQWVTIAKVWAAIEPLSAREFIAASAEQSKVSTRITVRARDDLDASMRIAHTVKGKTKFYNIEGLLTDKDSGLEYLTIPCSQGVRGQGAAV